MICHDKKAIFIHIPRTGGRSMEAFIARKHPFNAHHKSLKAVQKIKSGMYGDYFTFATVRNPFSRMVSNFHHYIEGGNQSVPALKIKKILSTMGFYSFIKNLDNLQDIIPGYHQEMSPFILEQHKWICDGDKILLDYLVRFENITEGARYVGKRLGIERAFPHKNKSNHTDYRDYYDIELIYIITQKYASDLELFYPELSPLDGRI